MLCVPLLMQVWVQPGFGLADDYLAFLESFTNNNPEATILLILAVFALFHSGLAGLRPQGRMGQPVVCVQGLLMPAWAPMTGTFRKGPRMWPRTSLTWDDL